MLAGQSLKDWRSKANLTQIQLAGKMSTTQKQISRAESGRANLTIDFISGWAYNCGHKFEFPKF